MVVCSNSRRVFKISYSLYVKKLDCHFFMHAKFTYIWLLLIEFILSQNLLNFEYEIKIAKKIGKYWSTIVNNKYNDTVVWSNHFEM